MVCHHDPPCPSAYSPARHEAHAVIVNVQQGWSLLCNGIIVNEVRDVGDQPVDDHPMDNEIRRTHGS
jgi:hypothetical protein